MAPEMYALALASLLTVHASDCQAPTGRGMNGFCDPPALAAAAGLGMPHEMHALPLASLSTVHTSHCQAPPGAAWRGSLVLWIAPLCDPPPIAAAAELGMPHETHALALASLAAVHTSHCQAPPGAA